MGKNAAKEAYRTGQGKVVVRSKVEIEETSKGKQQIVVSEIPFQVNKSRLIEKIAELVKDKKVEGISNIRDESDPAAVAIDEDRALYWLSVGAQPSDTTRGLLKKQGIWEKFESAKAH